MLARAGRLGGGGLGRRGRLGGEGTGGRGARWAVAAGRGLLAGVPAAERNGSERDAAGARLLDSSAAACRSKARERIGGDGRAGSAAGTYRSVAVSARVHGDVWSPVAVTRRSTGGRGATRAWVVGSGAAGVRLTSSGRPGGIDTRRLGVALAESERLGRSGTCTDGRAVRRAGAGPAGRGLAGAGRFCRGERRGCGVGVATGVRLASGRALDLGLWAGLRSRIMPGPGRGRRAGSDVRSIAIGRVAGRSLGAAAGPAVCWPRNAEYAAVAARNRESGAVSSVSKSLASAPARRRVTSATVRERAVSPAIGLAGTAWAGNQGSVADRVDTRARRWLARPLEPAAGAVGRRRAMPTNAPDTGPSGAGNE
jgi:hypothetical protein